ncbi:hypothetical protein Tco_0607223, partial [Tanacetum coccineum]
SMLLVAINPNAGQEHAAQAQSQPSSSPTPEPDTEPTQDEHIYEEQSPVYHHFSPPQEPASSYMPMDDLLQAVPKLMLTLGNAIVKL